MFAPHAIVKFKPNRLVQTTQILSFLKKKTKQKQKQKQKQKTIFDKALTPFWKTFLQLKQWFNAKLLISRLPSFSVPKLTIERDTCNQAKVALNVADPEGITDSRLNAF